MKKHPKTDRIVELYRKGLGLDEITERLCMAKSTVWNIIERSKKNG